jgi:steroid 5-alpha reductase family enzyme
LNLATLLLTNAVALVLLFLGLWAWSVRIKDASFIDAFWAFGMVFLAGLTWLQVGSAGERAHWIFALTALWGMRLGLHLLTRWRALGVDPRYIKMIGRTMEKKGWSFAKTSLLQVFALQAPLLFIVCLPAQLGPFGSDQGLGLVGWIGIAIALMGIAFEAIGDAQLKAFRAAPANKGKVLETGLWRYTRHPNYFGDCLTWWGIFILATDGPLGLWSLPGPVLLTFLLRKWSGVPLLEHSLSKSRPGYAEYVQRTSAFIPLLPKR